MSEGAARATSSRFARLLPLLLVPVALLSDPGAALPLRSYYFRDFGTAFYPLRLFQARELAAGRLPTWNPYVFEGTFFAPGPALYPLDLLHVLLPSPAFVSWLLTLHLPLAALATYWLARELRGSRAAAFVAGTVFALSGFALSCLNLYIFLQALALAPFVAGLLRRAALSGGRSIVWAAGAVALGLSTYTVEFVGQAVLLGIALGLAERAPRVALPRLAGALALGAGLAGLPIALVAGILGETARGAGFGRDVALANAVAPVVLLQTLLPHLFGFFEAPAEAFWGGRFFSKGLPYFLTLYLGPLTLGLAALGASKIERRARLALLALAGLALLYALGDAGGLAPLVHRLGLSGAFRFPSKALLLPQLAVALAAGFGFGRVAEERGALGRLALLCGLAAGVALAVFALVAARPAGLVAWSGVLPVFWPQLTVVVGRDVAIVVLLAIAVGGVLWLAKRSVLSTGQAAALVAALLVADLARAGVGLNPQIDTRFYTPLPELAALRLAELDGGRVFSYGLDHSPAFRELLRSGRPGLTLTSFFIHRQLLGPYANVLDGIEAAEANEITSFVPRERELQAEHYDPGRAGELVPWLRNAGVARVLSLDPLQERGLVLLGRVDAGAPGVAIHVYGFDAWPRGSLACRATRVASREEALAFPYREGFDPWREVALESPPGRGPDDAAAVRCAKGQARRTAFSAAEERYRVETSAPAYLVVRASHARGWQAWVDGVSTPVLRANGKHRAIAVAAGTHEVVLRYAPPGLRFGQLASGLALVACALVLALAGPAR
ncbi:MAG: YfhO family protein [Burkholderiales bacterium]